MHYALRHFATGVSCPFPSWGKAGMGAGIVKRIQPMSTFLSLPFQNENRWKSATSAVFPIHIVHNETLSVYSIHHEKHRYGTHSAPER